MIGITRFRRGYAVAVPWAAETVGELDVDGAVMWLFVSWSRWRSIAEDAVGGLSSRLRNRSIDAGMCICW